MVCVRGQHTAEFLESITEFKDFVWPSIISALSLASTGLLLLITIAHLTE